MNSKKRTKKRISRILRRRKKYYNLRGGGMLDKIKKFKKRVKKITEETKSFEVWAIHFRDQVDKSSKDINEFINLTQERIINKHFIQDMRSYSKDKNITRYDDVSKAQLSESINKLNHILESSEIKLETIENRMDRQEDKDQKAFDSLVKELENREKSFEKYHNELKNLEDFRKLRDKFTDASSVIDKFKDILPKKKTGWKWFKSLFKGQTLDKLNREKLKKAYKIVKNKNNEKIMKEITDGDFQEAERVVDALGDVRIRVNFFVEESTEIMKKMRSRKTELRKWQTKADKFTRNYREIKNLNLDINYNEVKLHFGNMKKFINATGEEQFFRHVSPGLQRIEVDIAKITKWHNEINGRIDNLMENYLGGNKMSDGSADVELMNYCINKLHRMLTRLHKIVSEWNITDKTISFDGFVKTIFKETMPIELKKEVLFPKLWGGAGQAQRQLEIMGLFDRVSRLGYGSAQIKVGEKKIKSPYYNYFYKPNMPDNHRYYDQTGIYISGKLLPFLITQDAVGNENYFIFVSGNAFIRLIVKNQAIQSEIHRVDSTQFDWVKVSLMGKASTNDDNNTQITINRYTNLPGLSNAINNEFSTHIIKHAPSLRLLDVLKMIDGYIYPLLTDKDPDHTILPNIPSINMNFLSIPTYHIILQHILPFLIQGQTGESYISTTFQKAFNTNYKSKNEGTTTFSIQADGSGGKPSPVHNYTHYVNALIKNLNKNINTAANMGFSPYPSSMYVGGPVVVPPIRDPRRLKRQQWGNNTDIVKGDTLNNINDSKKQLAEGLNIIVEKVKTNIPKLTQLLKISTEMAAIELLFMDKITPANPDKILKLVPGNVRGNIGKTSSNTDASLRNLYNQMREEGEPQMFKPEERFRIRLTKMLDMHPDFHIRLSNYITIPNNAADMIKLGNFLKELLKDKCGLSDDGVLKSLKSHIFGAVPFGQKKPNQKFQQQSKNNEQLVINLLRDVGFDISIINAAFNLGQRGYNQGYKKQGKKGKKDKKGKYKGTNWSYGGRINHVGRGHIFIPKNVLSGGEVSEDEFDEWILPDSLTGLISRTKNKRRVGGRYQVRKFTKKISKNESVSKNPSCKRIRKRKSFIKKKKSQKKSTPIS